jgi:hypothetical protein
MTAAASAWFDSTGGGASITWDEAAAVHASSTTVAAVPNLRRLDAASPPAL